MATQGELKKEGLQCGFSDYITKPFILTELLEVIASNLSIELQYDEKTECPEGVMAVVVPPPGVLEKLEHLLLVGDIDGVIAEVLVIKGGGRLGNMSPLPSR